MKPAAKQHDFGAVGALAMLTALFFLWGFITCLNDILIPHLKAVFDLTYVQVMLIQFCFFAAYFLVSVPSGYLVEWIGYQRGIVTGLVVAGLGCLLFYPAAGLRLYPLFLAAVFVLAAGITVLQVSANPYVALMGDAATASSRLTMTQAFNSLGTTLAPYFGALFILVAEIKTPEAIGRLDADGLIAYRLAEAAAVQMPYLLLAMVLLLTAGIFLFLKLPVIEPAQAAEAVDVSTGHGDEQPSAWHFPHLVLGAVGIFLYVGAEVAIGSFLVSFLSEPQISRMTVVEAAKLVPYYWGGAMVGRFLGAVVMRKIQPGKLLAFNAICAGLLVSATLVGSGQTAVFTILAVGLFNSIMFPTIFSLALKGLGQHTGQGSGILCCAIVGGAVIPLLQGWVADRVGVQPAFFIPLLCYVYIAYYGIRDAVNSSAR
jgi:MFS transporter, FHS family, L-fucose permease